MEKLRAHFIFGGTYNKNQTESKSTLLCKAPAVMAIPELISSPIKQGVVNVLYDESGTEKIMASIAVLEDY